MNLIPVSPLGQYPFVGLKWVEYFMRIAYTVASLSKDPRTRIGTVLVKDNVQISSGYNGFPRGVKDDPSRYNDREIKYNFVAHSEENSVLNCARMGISSYGSSCITFGIPCSSCAKTLIQGGIKEIITHKQWPEMNHVDKWVESVKISKIMFREAGISIYMFDKELGLKGFLDGKEIYV